MFKKSSMTAVWRDRRSTRRTKADWISDSITTVGKLGQHSPSWPHFIAFVKETERNSDDSAVHSVKSMDDSQ